MGRALKDGYRDKVLLTKFDGRTKKAAGPVRRIARRLQGDRIDLGKSTGSSAWDGPRFRRGRGVRRDRGTPGGQDPYIGFYRLGPLGSLRMLEAATRSHFHFDAVKCRST